MLLDKNKGLCGKKTVNKRGNASQSTDFGACKLVTENVGVAQLASRFGLCNCPRRLAERTDREQANQSSIDPSKVDCKHVPCVPLDHLRPPGKRQPTFSTDGQ